MHTPLRRSTTGIDVLLELPDSAGMRFFTPAEDGAVLEQSVSLHLPPGSPVVDPLIENNDITVSVQTLPSGAIHADGFEGAPQP